MALNLNYVAKRTTMVNALWNALFNNTGRLIRVFPDTVPFPSTCPLGTDTLPAGHILSFDQTKFTAGVSGNAIVFTAGTLTANTSAAGTLSWFAVFSTTGAAGNGFISDAVSLSGNGGVLIVSTLTPGNGDPVTIGLNLTAV